MVDGRVDGTEDNKRCVPCFRSDASGLGVRGVTAPGDPTEAVRPFDFRLDKDSGFAWREF